MVRPRALVVALVLAGCRGHAPAPAPHARGSAAHTSGAAKPRPDAGVDLEAAVPAWQAVVDRDHYLARRGEHGVVEGTLGPAVTESEAVSVTGSDTATDTGSDTDSDSAATPYTWLRDGTDSTGALAIRVRLGTLTAVTGDHLAIAGAWQADADHHWFWAASAVTRLPLPAPTTTLAAAHSGSAAAPDPTAVPPGHTIARGEPPAGAVPISQAHDGDAALFQLAGPAPALPGDGWPVGDRTGGAVVLLLDLPGERASYGAQDLRSPDERWHLARGATYWVRLGRVHHHGPTRPATVIARSAPVRVR